MQKRPADRFILEGKREDDSNSAHVSGSLLLYANEHRALQEPSVLSTGRHQAYWLPGASMSATSPSLLSQRRERKRGGGLGSLKLAHYISDMKRTHCPVVLVPTDARTGTRWTVENIYWNQCQNAKRRNPHFSFILCFSSICIKWIQRQDAYIQRYLYAHTGHWMLWVVDVTPLFFTMMSNTNITNSIG